MARTTIFALAFSSVFHPLSHGTTQDQRPNILFIYSDDHAQHAISAYGSAINQTPQIDRLAREGMLFTNSFVTNSICGPARATVLTGKYSHRNGFAQNDQSFDGDQPTVPKMLRQAGYQTAIIGKWHLNSDPQGFDHWFVLPGQGLYEDPWFLDNGTRIKVPGYVTDIITERSIEWLSQGRDKSKPFLLMCQHKAPHRNWQPAPRHAAMFADADVPKPVTFDDDWKNRSPAAADTTMTIEHHLTPNDVKGEAPEGLDAEQRKNWLYQRYIKDYLRCIAAVDESVGRVLDWLDESGLADNTIVIYSSDQGFYLGDHGWYDKRWMYEESLRTPMLVRWPGKVVANSECDAMVLNLDLAETFLDLAGLPIPADMQGQSLVPWLTGKTPTDWRQSMYYRYYEFPEPHHVQPHFGVRTKTHKLIRYPDIDAWEMFDLAADPHELHSIHASPEHAELRAELERELLRLQKEFGDDGQIHDPRLERFANVAPAPLARWAAPAKVGSPRFVAATTPDVPAWQLEGVEVIERRGSTRLSFDGSGFARLASRATFDLSYVPFTIGARFTPLAGDGVLCAIGGQARGCVLYLDDWVPVFSLREDGQVYTVRSTRPLPVSAPARVAAALGNDGRLHLFIDGRDAGSAPGKCFRAMPGDPLSVGADAGSEVLADMTRLRCQLEDVVVWRGTISTW
jgi:arylsulfatase A-like enzyme